METRMKQRVERERAQANQMADTRTPDLLSQVAPHTHNKKEVR